jgi:hypothetical protein
VCTESKEIQHLEVVECLPQGVRARLFERFGVGKNSGGIGPSSNHQVKAQEGCVVECSRKHHRFACRKTSSVEENSVIRRSHQEERTVGILRGESVNSHES